MNDTLPPWLDGIAGDYLPRLIENGADVVRVVAGPGSGKTTGLKRFVMRLVQRDGVDPAKIFVGTFTRVIAADLREKLGKDVGDVATLHAHAFKLLRENPHACEGYVLRFLLNYEERTMLYDVGHSHSEFGTQQKRRSTLLRIQSDWAERKELRDAAFWGETSRWLRRHGGMLIGEVVPHATQALEAEDIAPGQFDHVVVDEYQDLTACEQQLVEQIWSRNGSLTVLGDDDQSIYAFRYNHPDGINEFATRWETPPREDIPLPENRRSGKNIVDFANLMMAESGSTKDPMIPRQTNGGTVELVHWPTIDDEIEGLTRYINADRDKSFLVLVPRRSIGYRLRDAIGEDARTSFYQEALEHPVVQDRFAAASLLADPNDFVSVRAWLSLKASDSDPADRCAAEAYASIVEHATAPGIEFLRKIDEGRISPKGSGSQQIKGRARLFFELQDQVPDALTEQIRFLFDPDIAGSIEDEEKRRHAGANLTLLRQCALALTDEDKVPDLRSILRILRYRIATRAPLVDEDSEPRVTIMTLHGAKGLEADATIVAGVAEQITPGAPRENADENEKHREEQRRLLYVAVTRAKKELILSWPRRMSLAEAKQNGVHAATIRRNSGADPYVVLSRSTLLPSVGSEDSATQEAGTIWLSRTLTPTF